MRGLMRCAVVLAVVAAGSCARPSQDRGQSVTVSPLEFVAPPLLLSELSSGSGSVERVFEIRNSSREPRRITVGAISCGCLGLHHLDEQRAVKTGDEFSVGPGDAKSIRFSFRVVRKPELQRQTARFVVSGGDGDEEVSVQMVVPVLADLTISPPVISQTFGSSSGAPVEKHLRIDRVCRGETPALSVPRLVNLPPGVALQSMEETTPARQADGLWSRSWNVAVSVALASSTESTVASGFQIVFDDGTTPAVTVPVTFRRVSGIEVSPKAIEFGVVAPGKVLKRRALLASSDRRAFTITAMDSSSPLFTVSVDDDQPKPVHWIEISFTPIERVDCHAAVTVRTTYAEAGALTLAIQGVSQ
jgi:hypothetical protein